MKRKARIQMGIDDRLVAIYARKSRITNKGDSIGVQFKQSADYAINQLSLPEDYEFARYEDKGLSGYYSDRPDFQRLLRDIEMGKIKAVACYKLDRISRKTSDLMRLLEYFERHDVTLLVCSNNINTRISTSKIIIQVLAIIAEFERDILTERIQDNLMELAKDGRWLGGKTPTGFSSQRVTTGSGKNKSAISFLVPVQEEKEIVLEIYSTFWETRSLLQTANIISEKYETKHGAKFTTSTIRLILRNPIYCVADEYSYNYFLEHDGNLFGEPSDFDGQHGLTAYNKTDQMKVEDEDSTFFNPKFSQLLTRKPISEWIVSVGRHEGFISSRKWVETQNMLDEIAEKYNRPHRKTNALLSGLMYCPICGKRLRVLPESNRWTNGKPRFKYACPGVRAKECTFKGVEGVTLDEFVIHSLSSLQEEHSDYYRQLLENRVASMIRTDQSEKEYQETKKAIERLNADIAAQVRNLREADDALKRFIQDDIKELTDELAKCEAALRRMEDTQSENQYLVHELNGMKKRLLSFEEFAKDAQPEALFTLVHSIVDRIYITTDGTKQKCQVYIKGCATEDYSDVLGAAGYIEEEPLLPVVSYMPPMCDLDYYSIYDSILGLYSHLQTIFLCNLTEFLQCKRAICHALSIHIHRSGCQVFHIVQKRQIIDHVCGWRFDYTSTCFGTHTVKLRDQFLFVFFNCGGSTGRKIVVHFGKHSVVEHTALGFSIIFCGFFSGSVMAGFIAVHFSSKFPHATHTAFEIVLIHYLITSKLFRFFSGFNGFSSVIPRRETACRRVNGTAPSNEGTTTGLGMTFTVSTFRKVTIFSVTVTPIF